MPKHYGDILEWKYVDGLSVADIAARLGVGPKAAESLLTRARNAFRERMTALPPAERETLRRAMLAMPPEERSDYLLAPRE